MRVQEPHPRVSGASRPPAVVGHGRVILDDGLAVKPSRRRRRRRRPAPSDRPPGEQQGRSGEPQGRDGGRRRGLAGVPYARRYLTGQSISILGDTSLWLALGIWVRELTGSNALAGLTFFFYAAPSIAAPVWGTIADRFRRRPLLIGVNAVTGLLTLGLLGVHGRHQVWLIWLVMVAYGAGGSVLTAAQSGFLHSLVPDEHLGAAQGSLSTVREGLRLVSPLIGAGVFALVGGHAVAVVDAATFAVAAISVASIRLDEPAPVRAAGRWRAEVGAGLAHIREDLPLRQMVIALGAVCSVVGVCESAIFGVITTGLHLRATWIGPFEALMGVGALIGGPTVSAAMRRWGERRVSAIGMMAFAVGELMLAVPVLGLDAAGAVVAGFGLPWLIAASNTLIQRRTPSQLQGRVSGTVDVLTGTPQSASIALGAALMAVVGYQPLLMVAGIVTLAAGAWLISRPSYQPALIPSRG
jgi:MFS family permease